MQIKKNGNWYSTVVKSNQMQHKDLHVKWRKKIIRCCEHVQKPMVFDDEYVPFIGMDSNSGELVPQTVRCGCCSQIYTQNFYVIEIG